MSNYRLVIGVVGLVLGGMLGSACRPKQTLSARQSQTEAFFQNEQSLVDVLFVVDNSSSMGEEQELLAQSFDEFIERFLTQGVDFRIGVISTDVDDGGQLRAASENPTVLTNALDNIAGVFADNVSLGASGARVERSLENLSLSLGLMGLPPAAEFLRPEAALFVIALSDDDDLSFGPVKTYARALEGIKGPGNENLISFSAVAGPPGGCESAWGTANEGARYAELVELTGGRFLGICEPFAESLASLSFAALNLRTRFSIAGEPLLGSVVPECGASHTREGVCVLVNDEFVDDSWRIEQGDDGRFLVFEPGSEPPLGASIVVRYFSNQGETETETEVAGER